MTAENTQLVAVSSAHLLTRRRMGEHTRGAEEKLMRRLVRIITAGVLLAGAGAVALDYVIGHVQVRPGPTLLVTATLVAYVYALAGRGGRRRRDPRRWFDAQERALARMRAGSRCEYTRWGTRCSVASQEIDHFVPHCRGGATSMANAVCACRRHNQSKGGRMPSVLAAFALFWRRRSYFPDQVERWPGEHYHPRRASRLREEQRR